MIAHISDRKIDRMIFVLAGCDRNSCFVTSKYDGDEDCTMCVDIYSNKVLFIA